MVAKSKQEVRHIKDLQGVFEVLGKFLGYLITNRGIEVNPNQIEAVKRLKRPSNSKEVQVLTRMLAALNRFISKFTNRYQPFYQLLKKWRGF